MPTLTNSDTGHTTVLKISTSLIAGLALFNIIMMGSSFMLSNYAIVLMIQLGIGLITGLSFYAYWNYREQKNGGRLQTFPGMLQGLIRWWLAFEISLYGFAKILKTQFSTMPYGYDVVVGKMSGFSLTWFYFGYSYKLAVIIGCIQILGSILLLYRHTMLLGVMMLLPVMVNIVLINAFYAIAIGAFLNSVLFTIGLTYLFMLDFPRILETIKRSREALFPIAIKSVILKNGIRLLPVLLAFGGLFLIVKINRGDTVLYGAYTVEEFVRNGKLQEKGAWLKDSTVYSKVYFAGRSGVAFSPNPYRYEPSESFIADYTYNKGIATVDIEHKNEKRLTIITYKISDLTQEGMVLNTIHESDTVQMKLKKIR